MTTTTETPRIQALPTVTDAQVQALADLLIDCVEGGASVSFMLPIARATADAFWCSVAAGVERGERILVVAENAAGQIIGTVQIILAQVENQPLHAGRLQLAERRVHLGVRRLHEILQPDVAGARRDHEGRPNAGDLDLVALDGQVNRIPAPQSWRLSPCYHQPPLTVVLLSS